MSANLCVIALNICSLLEREWRWVETRDWLALRGPNSTMFAYAQNAATLPLIAARTPPPGSQR